MTNQPEALRESPLYQESIQMLERLRVKGLLSQNVLQKAQHGYLSLNERDLLLSIVEVEIDGPGFDDQLDELNAYGERLEVLATWLSGPS